MIFTDTPKIFVSNFHTPKLNFGEIVWLKAGYNDAALHRSEKDIFSNIIKRKANLSVAIQRSV